MKQSECGFCLGFLKLTVEDCKRDPSILKSYFEDYEHCSEYIVQEAIEGFTRNWETRCFWYNGEFQYAICNMAGVSTEDGKERIITGDEIPAEFLENAKRIGAQAVKCLPKLQVAGGGELPMVLVRTDIGCSDSQIYDKDFNWDPTQRTFFLNEIEPCSTTYFVRHLKFDCIPLYGKLWGSTLLAYKEQLEKNRAAKKSRAGPLKKASQAKGKAKASVAKKPAKAKTAAMKTMKTSMKIAPKTQVMKAMKATKAKSSMKAMKAVKAMKAMKAGRR
jgi:hypothetical protein